jgi:hypothetical protein
MATSRGRRNDGLDNHDRRHVVDGQSRLASHRTTVDRYRGVTFVDEST